MSDYDKECESIFLSTNIIDRDVLPPLERTKFDHGALVFKSNLKSIEKQRLWRGLEALKDIKALIEKYNLEFLSSCEFEVYASGDGICDIDVDNINEINDQIKKLEESLGER